MYITDGTGKGYQQKVNQENMGVTLSYTHTFDHHANCTEQSSYSAVLSLTPDADSDFFYLKNTSDEIMIITSLSLFSDSTEHVELYLNKSGTPVGGTDLTPVNRVSGCANTADCVCKYGTPITGLSGDDLVERLVMNGQTEQKKYVWLSDIILPKNTNIVLRSIYGAQLYWTLAFYFHICL